MPPLSAFLRPYRSIAGKKILLLSNLYDRKYDRKYDEVFLGEIRKDADVEQVQLLFQKLSEPDYPGLTLGEYIAAQEVDGVILLSFTSSALSIYHAIREGFDVVSDIHYPELPMLAVVQTDNYKHSYEAELLMSQKQGRFIRFEGAGAGRTQRGADRYGNQRFVCHYAQSGAARCVDDLHLAPDGRDSSHHRPGNGDAGR